MKLPRRPSVQSARAFNTIAMIGIVLRLVVMVMSLSIRNYKFDG